MSGSRRPLCSTWVRLKCRIVMRELMQQRWRTWRFPCCSERGFCVLARTIFWWICARMLFVQPSRVLVSRVVLQTAGKPYSLRRGGATHLFITTKSYSQVCQAGRWSAERTVRIYIQDSFASNWPSLRSLEPPRMRKYGGRERDHG